MQITGAPLAFACRTNGQRCGFDVSVFVPHRMMSFASPMVSGSVPIRVPYVIVSASEPHAEQIVRASCDAPMRRKTREAIPSPCTSPIVPA